MRTRVITALVALCVLFPFLYFSGTIMLEIFVSVLATVSVYEMLNCAKLAKKWCISIPSYVLAYCVPYIIRHFGDRFPIFSLLGMILILYLFYLMVAAVFSHWKVSVTESAFTFMITVYVVFSFSCILLVRDLPFGQYIYLLIFMSAWMSDSGAYFAGRLFGRHKLIEDVSPKKTVEGAVGGVIICSLSFLLYGFIVGQIFDATPRYPALALVGAILSVISQCGDLIASLIKRQFGIKDYGWVFPGHGGVMDRFDSIIAIAPFLYLLSASSSFFQIFF